MPVPTAEVIRPQTPPPSAIVLTMDPQDAADLVSALAPTDKCTALYCALYNALDDANLLGLCPDRSEDGFVR